ncbi:hypothetical protein FNYG_14826 [Fusarium nygamai]|uniref:Uncharacterized protein n=1 Tax=Gibberella nygamai TaxID=42673 RepID=A0A2K0UQ18_GIBNY|nr:hypothetical protein FNYG_14826 [Fusarium nygamai]
MSDSKKSAATPSDKFSCFFQTDASKPKPKAPRSKAKVDKLAEPKTAQKPARGSKRPFKANSPVVIADSEGPGDEEAMESQAVTPVRRRIRTKRAATQDLTPATKRLKSIELLVGSSFDEAPTGEASPELTTRSSAPAQRHAVACRECIDKWRTNPSWVCEMAESGKRPCLSCEADGLGCSDDMLEESRMDVQRVHGMAHRHRRGLAVDPEEWRTGLSWVLSSIQTFDAWQRARAASMQVEQMSVKIERHMREERAETKALKEALEKEKSLRKKLEGQVKAMQAQLDGLEAAKDGDDEDDDEGGEEGNVGETQDASSEE